MSAEIRVLHVDDEPDFADLVTTFLEREDDQFVTETATSASDGLDRLSANDFDCVISDYDMPRQDGIAFLKAVRESYPELPFILYTGKGSEAIASEAVSAGVTDYLQKESGTDQYTILANRVKNAVKRRKAQRDRKRQLEAIETAQEGISILDEDGHYIYVNQAFADMHGYTPDELIGEHWKLVYQEDDIPEVREVILPEVEQTGYWHGETTSLRADGSTVTVDHTLSITEQGELVCTVRDLSDQKQRQRELHQRTARLEALFEHSPDMINVHDTDGNILDPNPRLCEKTGYDASELTEMKVWELDQAIAPDEAQAMWETMAVGDSRRIEGAYQRRDGSTFPVEVHIRRLRIEGEEQFVAIARDISERKEQQRELERQNERLADLKARYESLFEHNPVVIWEEDFSSAKSYVDTLATDVDDVETYLRAHPEEIEAILDRVEILDVNETAVQYYGAESKQELMEQFTELTTDDTLAANAELWAQIAAGATEYRTETVSQTLAGERRDEFFELRVPEMYADDYSRVYISAIDITERKHRERELRTQRDKIRALHDIATRIESCETPAAVYDQLISAAEDVLQFDIAIADSVEDDRLVPQAVSSELSGEEYYDETPIDADDNFGAEAYRTEETILVDDLETHDVAPADPEFRSALTVPIGKHGVFQAVARAPSTFDDSDRELAELLVAHAREQLTQLDTERQLRAQTEELTRQNERLEEFASVVSHDLRNPLNVVQGRLELAREECASEHLEDAVNAVDRSLMLIDDLLTLAREGKPIDSVTAVDLGEVSEECWQNVTTAGATLVNEAERPIKADRSRLKQLLENLIGNAVEHGGDDVTITIGELADGFYVADDGPGIPAGERADVFEAGYSTADDGTGFGLSIVAEIVEAHGWTITVTESDAGGARFEITGVTVLAE